jgi:hypothetical protein
MNADVSDYFEKDKKTNLNLDLTDIRKKQNNSH